REGGTQLAGVLEGDGAGEGEVVPALDARAGHLDVSAEAVQHRPVGRPLLLEDPEDVVMGVAVVDLQRLVQTLGEVDVPPECLLLDADPLRARAEVVQSGLAHDPDPGVRGQLGDLRIRARQLAPGLQPRHLGGMRGHATERGTVDLHGRDRVARTRQVAADLHDAVHPDGAGLAQRLGEVRTRLVTTAHVEVGVVVDDRNRQGIRRSRSSAMAAVATQPTLSGHVSPAPSPYQNVTIGTFWYARDPNLPHRPYQNVTIGTF